MKPTLSLFAILFAMLFAGVSHSQIIVSGSSPFEKIQFSLVVRQQDSTEAGGSPIDRRWTAKTMRLGNKDILKLLAAAFHTEWPKGAQLGVYRDDWGDGLILRYLYVLDKDGNPLWSCNEGYFIDETNRAFLSVSSGNAIQDGWSKWKGVNKRYYNTYYQMISFHLYRNDDTDSSAFTDLELQGLNAEKYYFRYISRANSYPYVHITSSDRADLSAEGWLNGTWTVVSGTVSISWKWEDQF
jgi:hypothetical protein